MAITLEELEIKFTAQTSSLNSQLSGVKNQLTGLEGTANKAQFAVAAMIKGGLIAAAVMAGRELVKIGKESLDMANDVVESEQLFSVSMGNMEASARAWSESLSASLGLNAYDLRKNVGMLNVMFDSMGAGEQEAYDMSTSMVELANDMASFYNLSTTEAFDKLRAGITGETEPLKRLGILVDENTVKQFAYKNGIAVTGKELTQQQKLQARYGAIMEQTAKAQGDLARTMDSPTNQLRRLNAEFDMAKIALGQALQPALIAVLPVMSSFANGLARMLKGGGVSTGNPFSDVVVSLASATATVSTGVSTLTQETVAKVNELKAQVETALKEYAAAASATKTAYINITMKPDTTVYERVQKTLRELDAFIGEEAAQGIQKDVQVWMDAAMQDGEVSSEDIKTVRENLKARIEALLKAQEDIRVAGHAVVNLKMKNEEYKTEADFNAAHQAVEDAYATATGGIQAIGIEVAAELGITDWTMPSLSPDDRELMRKSMQDTMDKELAVALEAKATATALFDGTGNVENVVEGVYANALSLLETKRQQISDLMNNSIDADWDWSKINGLRQEMADIISFITTGITPQGEFNKALFDLQKLSPESLTNFAKAYKNTLNTMRAAEQEQLNMRENLLFALNASGDTLGIQKILDQYGYKSFDEAILSIRKQSADSGASVQGDFLSGAANVMVPQLQSMMDNARTPEEVSNVKDMIYEMLSAVDYSNLNEDGKKAVQSLANLMDSDKVRFMFGSDTNFFGVIDDYLRQIYNDNYGQGGGVPMPNPYRVGDDNTPPAWYSQPLMQTYNPLAHEGKGVSEVVIDRPKLTIQDFLLGSGQRMQQFESSLAVSIAPLTINTTLELDGTTLGRATITAQQTVVKNTGGGRGVPATVLPY